MRPWQRANTFMYRLYMFQLVVPMLFLFLAPPGRAALGFALLVCMGACYRASFRNVGINKLWWAWAETAITLCLVFFLNFGYMWLLYYPVAQFGLCLRGRRLFLTTFGITALNGACAMLAAHWQHASMVTCVYMALSACAAMMASAFAISRQEENARARIALENANREIERLTKVAERERISQDLHDVIGHDLSLITLKAQLVRRLIDHDPARAKQEIHDVEQAARQALTRVREYIAAIRLPDFEEEWEDAQKLLRAAGISCEAALQTYPNALTAREASRQPEHAVLAMCLREAVTNVVRHSRAARAALSMVEFPDRIELMVSDDGVGIRTTPQCKETSDMGTGHGLSGIRARLDAVDGKLRVWSNGTWVLSHHEESPLPQLPFARGTTIVCSVPRVLETGRSAQEAVT